jgi:arylsulfatase
MQEAAKYDVFPLDDRYVERAMPENRPQPNAGRTSFTYYPGTVRITEGMAPDMKNRSYSVRAKVEIPVGGADGMLMTQGGWFGGTALMLLKHKPTFVYSLSHYPENKWTIQSGSTLSPGKHTISMDFAYAGGGVGKGAVVTLSVDDKVVAKGEIPRTIPVRVSVDETLDFGEDTGTPVIRAYEVPFRFTGKLESVTIDLR